MSKTRAEVYDATDDVPERIHETTPDPNDTKTFEKKPLKSIRYKDLPPAESVEKNDLAKWLRKQGYAAPVRAYNVVGVKRDQPQVVKKFDACDESEAIRLYLLSREDIRERDRHTWQFRAEPAEE